MNTIMFALLLFISRLCCIQQDGGPWREPGWQTVPGIDAADGAARVSDGDRYLIVSESQSRRSDPPRGNNVPVGAVGDAGPKPGAFETIAPFIPAGLAVMVIALAALRRGKARSAAAYFLSYLIVLENVAVTRIVAPESWLPEVILPLLPMLGLMGFFFMAAFFEALLVGSIGHDR